MTTSTPFDEVEELPTLPRELAAEIAADIARMQVLHADHPQMHLAAHVAEMMVAAANAMRRGVVQPADAERSVEGMLCVCETTVTAAVYLLARSYLHSGYDHEGISRLIASWATALVSD
jgi:hypothetical protein